LHSDSVTVKELENVFKAAPVYVIVVVPLEKDQKRTQAFIILLPAQKYLQYAVQDYFNTNLRCIS
jgi:hypothetical protein